MLYKCYIIYKMCNIYKNNLILLSQIEAGNLIYYDSEYNLRNDDRYLSYLRKGTKETKISDIIKISYLKILNSFIVNLVSQENISNSETHLIEIENRKHLLRKSLEGLNTYLQTLKEQGYEHQILENTVNILEEIFKNMEKYKDDYLQKIKTPIKNSPASKSWLYSLYESTLKSETSNKIPVSVNHNNSLNLLIDTEPNIDSKLSNTKKNETVKDLDNKNDSVSEKRCEKGKEKINQEILNNICDKDNCWDDMCHQAEESSNFIQGFIYIITRKITYILFTVTKHIKYFF